MSAPSLDGSDRSGGPVEKEGGVFSCPFDNSQSCYIVPAFQTKNGEFCAMGNWKYNLLSYLLVDPSLHLFSFHIPLSPPLLPTDSNPQAELFDSFLSGDNRSYEGELLGYSLRSLDNHVVVRY